MRLPLLHTALLWHKAPVDPANRQTAQLQPSSAAGDKACGAAVPTVGGARSLLMHAWSTGKEGMMGVYC